MRVSIATKVFLGFSLVLLTSGLVSVYGVVRLHRIGERLDVISRGYFPLTRAASSLDAFQKERTRNADRLLEEQDPVARRSLLAIDRNFSRVVSGMFAAARSQVQGARDGTATARDREALERIDGRLALLGTRIAEEEQAATALTEALGEKDKGAPAEQAALIGAVARLRTAERRVDQEVKTLLGVIQDQMNGGVSEAKAQETEARWAVVGLSVIALLVGLLITWLANRALRPIGSLTEAAQRLGRGSPETVAAVPERGGDELSLLAREFNAMAQRLALRERELRAQGETLLRSERLAAIGRIAAQITHEIRNPLSSISLNAEELGERVRGENAEAAALCDAIAREVDRLAAVTEEYLRFARLPKPQLSRADLTESVCDLLDFLRPELHAAGVQLEARLVPGLPAVVADVGQIRQLLLNLIRNAREAMPGGGALFVGTSADENGVTVEVRDRGPGIPPERLQRIFDPFFTTKERGTGLGLALAQEIAQEHGGRLTCASTPGEGTAFFLRLPVAAEAKEPPQDGAVAAAIAPS